MKARYPSPTAIAEARQAGLRSKGLEKIAEHYVLGGGNQELGRTKLELRERFKDARLHAAINCASESCPPLLNEAFVASKLDDQLQTQMRAFVNDPDRNVIDPANDRLRLSEIFKWFKEDFERDAGSVREYLIRFASPETAEFLREKKIRYLDYSWKLNDAPERS